jgi:hypothetical protein
MENPAASRDFLTPALKELLPHLVRLIPETAYSYTHLFGQFICLLTVKLDKLETQIQTHDLKVHVFSCSVFDDNAELLHAFEQVSRVNSVNSFRVFELIIQLACVSSNHLQVICESKFNLSKLIAQNLSIDNSDVLAQLNCIELLTELIRTKHGYEYIAQSGHLGHLLSALTNPELNAFAAFLQPSIVKLFSLVVREQPLEVKQHFGAFYTYLFNLALSDNLVNDLTSIILGVDTLCFLCESNPVKRFYNENYQGIFFVFLEKLGWLLKHAINEQLKESVLKCISTVIAVDSSLLTSEEQTDTKWSLSAWNTPEWYELSKLFYSNLVKKLTHEEVFNLCLSIAKKPFHELRLAAQRYFKALAQTEWGVSLLFTPNKYNSTEQFFEAYLLNRSVEVEKAGLESKYELIKLLVANFSLNEDLIPLIGDDLLGRLKHYVSEGAFFVRAQTQVAFEST